MQVFVVHALRAHHDSVMQRDLKGKFCMVTGCNQGIGYQAAQVGLLL